MTRQTLQRIARSVLSGKVNIGICSICGHKTLFIKLDDWLRDNYLCVFCRSIPRQRALINILEKRFPDWRRLRIHESSPGGASSDKLMSECGGYIPTQYFPDVPPGSYKNRVRCENLEKLTFENELFDLVITQDVLEHIMNPARAFAEIARTLKPGGAHVFTVPWYHRKKTVARARETAKGIEYLHDPIFHVNPIDEKGSLVVSDWGDDLLDFIRESSGMETEAFHFDDPRLGLEAEFLEVFVSMKRQENA